MADVLRLAVAQTTVPEDPTDPGTLRESGAQIRTLMREASAAGAWLVQFPEGAIIYPSKPVMSSAGPDRIAAADWSRLDWTVLRAEAEAIAALARELGGSCPTPRSAGWTRRELSPLAPPGPGRALLDGAGRDGVEARCTVLAFASGLDGDRLRAWCRAIAPIVAITRLRRPGSQQAVAELLALAR